MQLIACKDRVVKRMCHKVRQMQVLWMNRNLASSFQVKSLDFTFMRCSPSMTPNIFIILFLVEAVALDSEIFGVLGIFGIFIFFLSTPQFFLAEARCASLLPSTRTGIGGGQVSVALLPCSYCSGPGGSDPALLFSGWLVSEPAASIGGLSCRFVSEPAVSRGRTPGKGGGGGTGGAGADSVSEELLRKPWMSPLRLVRVLPLGPS
mmetsp:Transcript_26584/g.52392  ORF Transcript_26584/g.52392 Transcript_26584/m.52392 type:complete len:206 (-) Transcript_26584:2567-3184(-)